MDARMRNTERTVSVVKRKDLVNALVYLMDKD